MVLKGVCVEVLEVFCCFFEVVKVFSLGRVVLYTVFMLLKASKSFKEMCNDVQRV